MSIAMFAVIWAIVSVIAALGLFFASVAVRQVRGKQENMEFWEVSSQEFFDQFDPQPEDWEFSEVDEEAE